MRVIIIVLIAVSLCAVGAWQYVVHVINAKPSSPIVTFADERLEQALMKQFRRFHDAPKPFPGYLTEADLARIDKLTLQGDAINLSGIEHCVILTTLRFAQPSSPAGLTPVGRLTNLQVLEFQLPLEVVNLRPLGNLTNLRELSVKSRNWEEWDLAWLAELDRLQVLHLHLGGLSDLSPLRELTELKDLAIWWAGDSLTDISPLADLTKLEELQLGGNGITDLTPLSELTNLRVLFLESNQITDVAPLGNLTKLQWLSVGNNRIGNISPLAALTDLRVLHVNHNEIEDISALVGMHNLGDVRPLDGRRRWFKRIQVWRKDSGAGLSHSILAALRLDRNRIEDISPLVENPGIRLRPEFERSDEQPWRSPMPEAKKVNLSRNPLSEESTASGIPSLEERGVEVFFDPGE